MQLFMSGFCLHGSETRYICTIAFSLTVQLAGFQCKDSDYLLGQCGVLELWTASSSRLNVQVIDRERVAEIFQIYIYCIIEYFPAPIKLSWAPWRAKYTFYERGGLVSCSFCRWNDRETEGKRKRERERIKLRLLYLCSRVEWFSTFWRLSKLDKLLPIRIIFRISIPKDQQVWPCDKILILKKSE